MECIEGTFQVIDRLHKSLIFYTILNNRNKIPLNKTGRIIIMEASAKLVRFIDLVVTYQQMFPVMTAYAGEPTLPPVPMMFELQSIARWEQFVGAFSELMSVMHKIVGDAPPAEPAVQKCAAFLIGGLSKLHAPQQEKFLRDFFAENTQRGGGGADDSDKTNPLDFFINKKSRTQRGGVGSDGAAAPSSAIVPAGGAAAPSSAMVPSGGAGGAPNARALALAARHDVEAAAVAYSAPAVTTLAAATSHRNIVASSNTPSQILGALQRENDALVARGTVNEMAIYSRQLEEHRDFMLSIYGPDASFNAVRVGKILADLEESIHADVAALNALIASNPEIARPSFNLKKLNAVPGRIYGAYPGLAASLTPNARRILDAVLFTTKKDSTLTSALARTKAEAMAIRRRVLTNTVREAALIALTAGTAYTIHSAITAPPEEAAAAVPDAGFNPQWLNPGRWVGGSIRLIGNVLGGVGAGIGGGARTIGGQIVYGVMGWNWDAPAAVVNPAAVGLGSLQQVWNGVTAAGPRLAGGLAVAYEGWQVTAALRAGSNIAAAQEIEDSVVADCRRVFITALINEYLDTMNQAFNAFKFANSSKAGHFQLMALARGSGGLEGGLEALTESRSSGWTVHARARQEFASLVGSREFAAMTASLNSLLTHSNRRLADAANAYTVESQLARNTAMAAIKFPVSAASALAASIASAASTYGLGAATGGLSFLANAVAPRAAPAPSAPAPSASAPSGGAGAAAPNGGGGASRPAAPQLTNARQPPAAPQQSPLLQLLPPGAGFTMQISGLMPGGGANATAGMGGAGGISEGLRRFENSLPPSSVSFENVTPAPRGTFPALTNGSAAAPAPAPAPGFPAAATNANAMRALNLLGGNSTGGYRVTRKQKKRSKSSKSSKSRKSRKNQKRI